MKEHHELINEFYDDSTLKLLREKEPRGHLGASQIGSNCIRSVFLNFRWIAGIKDHSPRLLRLFERGKNEEKIIKDILEAGNCKIDSDYKHSFSDFDGHYGGECDGVLNIENTVLQEITNETRILLECKTTKDGQLFNKYRTNDLLSANFKYFVQVQTYLKELNLEYCLFVVVNKNTDEVILKLIKKELKISDYASQIAKDIIYAKKVPDPLISGSNKDHPECYTCDLNKQCKHKINIHQNCRSCKYSKPVKNSEWFCIFHHKLIPKDKILKQYQCWESILDD